MKEKKGLKMNWLKLKKRRKRLKAILKILIRMRSMNKLRKLKLLQSFYQNLILLIYEILLSP